MLLFFLARHFSACRPSELPLVLLKFTYELLISCHSSILSRFELLSYDVISVTLRILTPISYVNMIFILNVRPLTEVCLLLQNLTPMNIKRRHLLLLRNNNLAASIHINLIADNYVVVACHFIQPPADHSLLYHTAFFYQHITPSEERRPPGCPPLNSKPTAQFTLI